MTHHVQPRADHTRIATLEFDLLGIEPEPGSAAAAHIASRQTRDCEHPCPVNITSFSDPAPVALCSGCGLHLVHDANGSWVVAHAR
jgi:hypothetical protein